MKPYQQVIAERYDGRERRESPLASRYSLLHPLGLYLTQRARETMVEAMRRLQAAGLDLERAHVLDVGCGHGAWTRFFAELTGHPEQVTGFDLSEHRVAQARSLHPAIRIERADLLHLPLDDTRYDVAAAMTVLMHLATRAELDQALRGIADSLRPGGWLLWYDVVVRDHFAAAAQAESSGFSPEQAIELGQAAGLRFAFQLPVYRHLLWGRPSYYWAGRGAPVWLVRALEAVLPGPPCNMLWAFRKPLA